MDLDSRSKVPRIASNAEAHRGDLQFEGGGIRSTIAICTVGELFGGVERHVMGMLEGLKARGVETTLVLFHDCELAMQARLHGFSPVIMSSNNLGLLVTARELARHFGETHTGIVHTHGYKATVFCALARMWHPMPMVKTEHGLPESMAGRPFSAMRDRAYRWLSAAIAKAARARTCYVSQELRAHYEGASPIKPSQVIPNGIIELLSSTFPRPPEYFEGVFNLAIVGRLDTVKGHRFAIEAMSMQGVAANTHLHVVGTGPCESELRALAEAIGIGDRVHFVGFRRNVYDYIAHCDALLMPSLHEGLPYALLEAMALATPIIASNVGGLAEVLRDGFTALLVPPSDAEALARAISRLVNNPDLGHRLAQEAQLVQRLTYSVDAMTESYLAVYRELLMPKD